MKKSVLRKKWSEEQLSYLKEEYLQGSSLKKIATTLNRSVSAINKVLARHNLRTHSKLERLPDLHYPTLQQIQQKRELGTQLRQQSIKKKSLQDRYIVKKYPLRGWFIGCKPKGFMFLNHLPMYTMKWMANLRISSKYFIKRIYFVNNFTYRFSWLKM